MLNAIELSQIETNAAPSEITPLDVAELDLVGGGQAVVNTI